MKALTLTLAISCGLVSGCTLLGYHRYRKAPRAPEVEAAKVTFPTSLETATKLDGPAVAALEVAMNDFMPPGAKVTADDEHLAQCLSRRDTYDVAVVKSDNGLYFVYFTADLSRCGLSPERIVLDIDSTYAIDSTGRILAVQ
jgi:hypothetical protein